jgi:hypothetical protein
MLKQNHLSPIAMTPLFKKLNLKDQNAIIVLNAPSSFDHELDALDGVAIERDGKNAKAITFAMAFATTQAEVDKFAKALATKLPGDAVLWMCYPKGTSKKYQCDFNRDTGWASLVALGWDTVRQVAIDEDWSALRFRRNEYIKR